EPLLRECLEIRRKVLPKGHWLTADAESVIGACLFARGCYTDAELLLLSGYEHLKAAPQVPIEQLPKAGDRLIRLYEAWGKPENAAEWRARRDQLPKAPRKLETK